MVQCSGLWRVDVQVSQTDILIWSVLHTTWRRHIDLLTEPSGISSAAAVIQRWHLKIEDSWSQNSFTFCVLLILCSVSDLCGLLFIVSFCFSLTVDEYFFIYLLLSDSYFEKNNLLFGQNRLHLWVYDLSCSSRRPVARTQQRHVLVAAGVSWPGGHGGPTPATGLSSSCPSGRGS